MTFLLRYMKVGIFNTFITFLSYLFFINILDLQPSISYLIAASLATVINVLLHGKITVKENVRTIKFLFIFFAYFFANIICFLTIHFIVLLTHSNILAFFLGVISYQIIYLPSLYIINFRGVGE